MNALDMPKLGSPFVREMIGGAYVVTPKVHGVRLAGWADHHDHDRE